MATMHIFPVGNGDSILIEFEDERLMLVDFCNLKCAEDDEDKRINLADALRTILDEKGRDSIDIVAFTHPHDDHLAGSDEFFWLRHAKKYQDDTRIRIDELWMPAGMVVTEGLEGCSAVIRAEARHRLEQGEGIRVFSAPDEFDKWLDDHGLGAERLGGLITHAGEVVPGISADDSNAEVFVHAPFSAYLEDCGDDRNGSSLVLHLTFFPNGSAVRVMLGADAEHEVWQDIVNISEKYNDDRLDWDIFKIAHHGSHNALAPEAGTGVTVPVDEVQRLFGRGANGCILVASCHPIDTENTPPHPETAAYYESVARGYGGEWLVTMEYPNESAPKPIVIRIGEDGVSVDRSSKVGAGAAAVIGTSSPRMG